MSTTGGRGLAQVLVDSAPAAARSELQALPALDAALEALMERARAEWPTVELPDEAFVRYLAERLPSEGDAAKALEGMHAEDLYLACACARGDSGAIALFEEHIARKALATLRGGVPDEVRSQLREKLFVPTPKSKITEYSGRGPAVKWVRMVALRLSMDARKGAVREVQYEEGSDELTQLIELDPELKVIKDRARRELEQALRSAFTQLDQKERRLLRLHHLDGLPHGKIGTIYGTPRSTVAYWLSQAREKLLDLTRRALAERLHLHQSELDSLIQLVRSQVDLSMSLLQDPKSVDED